MSGDGATTLEQVRERLDLRVRFKADDPALGAASVALILRERGGDLELLFIRRAEKEGDHWSGHIAFPGGRLDAADSGPRHTAERETAEEVGIVLEPADRLGRLDDLRGQSRSIVVSAFVYGFSDERDLLLNHEVAEAFWIPLVELLDPGRHVKRSFHHLDRELDLPAIRVLDDAGPEAPLLWGLSYRFLDLLMLNIARAIPSMPWREDL
ncbi:MAG: CoA pyrophosphatase [Deltaproteobacteria bacterium]|nr:CoA pyrophosphatase [Deltaproteobacteria bacterium]